MALADYARFQANALVDLGIEVHLLTCAGFPSEASDRFQLKPYLKIHPRGRVRLLNKLQSLRELLASYRELAHEIRRGKFQHVLLGSYAEYFSPLWSGPFRDLARRGVVFGAVVHDPVRDFVVGPLCWHRHSIADAYSFLREAFVHDAIALDTVRAFPRLRTTVIPHGPYGFSAPTLSRDAVRRQLGVPESAELWISFGAIRDSKNLDLIIPALVDNPQAWLLVAGRELSIRHKNAAFYQDLARRLRVDARCVWVNRFIEENEIGNLFTAADLALLTYRRDFRSASGVLNAAVHFRRPCIVSSGPGNLRSVVQKYQLGVWVESDSALAIRDGLRQWRTLRRQPAWDAYFHEQSWEVNARLVAERLLSLPRRGR